jgi:DNA-binding beta-propeller fold protein YncE
MRHGQTASMTASIAASMTAFVTASMAAVMAASMAAVMTASVAAVSGAQSSAHSLWVTLGDSDQLVEVDPNSFREIRRITVDRGVHGLAVSADGSKVYVCSDKTGMFQIVDVRKGAVVAQIAIGKDPNQMTLTRDGRFAYVPMRGEAKVAVVQLDPLRLVKKLDARAGPHDAYTSPDGKRIYVGNQFGREIRSSTRRRRPCCTKSGPRTACAPFGRRRTTARCMWRYRISSASWSWTRSRGRSRAP